MSTISVILSTYNAPAWLEKVLWGYRFQNDCHFEVIVADDGSTPETAQLLSRFSRSTGLSIRHVWHEDVGFRKSEILNKAMLEATGDYLIFSDADCIPRRNFVAQHRKFAAEGYFLSGGLVRLPKTLSEQLDVNDILSGRATNAKWLMAQGLPRDRKTRLLMENERWGQWFDWFTTTRATWNGHNASGWRRDLLRVNGFDQRMGYGGMDRELGERLINAGVRSRQIRHRAACVHLDHTRPYQQVPILELNQQIRRLTVGQRLDWTPDGIFSSRGAMHRYMTHGQTASTTHRLRAA